MSKTVIDYYTNYDEEGRLFRDYSHQIEWLTTMHYFDRVLPPCSKIFDGCAGTGNYAFELARKGHYVVASDIVPHNVDIMKEKQKQKPLLQDIFVSDICKVSQYENQAFDIVLCMGAFYHLDEEKRYCAMKECLRLLKKDGLLVISYINLMAALYLHMDKTLENMDKILECYDVKGFGDSFVYMTPDEIEQMAEKFDLKIIHHLTVDGNPKMRSAEFNGARQDDFDKFMELHMNTCENKYLLGYGLHGLVFLEKYKEKNKWEQY